MCGLDSLFGGVRRGSNLRGELREVVFWILDHTLSTDIDVRVLGSCKIQTPHTHTHTTTIATTIVGKIGDVLIRSDSKSSKP